MPLCPRCRNELPVVHSCTADDSNAVAWNVDSPELQLNPSSVNLLRLEDDGLYGAFPEHVTNPPFARIRAKFDKPIGTGAGANIIFEVADEDDEALPMWGGNPLAPGGGTVPSVNEAKSRLYARFNGVYEIGCSAALDIGVLNVDWALDLRRNGSSTTVMARRKIRCDDISHPVELVVATDYLFTAGEYFTCFASHDRGTSQNIFASPEASPIAWMRLVCKV